MSQAKQVRAKELEGASSLSFVDYLNEKLRQAPPALKGERTRERLKIATATILETRGYHAMRVADITKEAGFADGSFYVYFKDKKDAALATLSSYLSDFVDAAAPLEAVGTPFDSIRAAQQRWFNICHANAGLVRCVFQLGDEDADFASLVQRTTRGWYMRVARNLQLDHGSADGKTLLLAVYLMGSMMDEIVRKLIVFPDREFQKLMRTWGADDEAIVDAASLIWVRTFDPTAKPPAGLSPAAERLAQMIWGRGSK